MTLTTWKVLAGIGWLVTIALSCAVFWLFLDMKDSHSQTSAELDVIASLLQNNLNTGKAIEGAVNGMGDDLASSTASIRTDIHTLAGLDEVGSPAPSVFSIDTSESEARRLIQECLSTRMSDLMGPMGHLYMQSSSGEVIADEFFNSFAAEFADGDLSMVQQVGIIGVLMGCWTLDPQLRPN